MTDPATGLILTTFRYYDPSNGRFLNRDPIGYDGGINLDCYCNNNPIVENDQLGELGECEIDIGGIIYSPNKVGDKDTNKGYPHWDPKCGGGGSWIGNDGCFRDRNGNKTKIKNKGIIEKIRIGVEKWPVRSGGKPVIPPQNKFSPYDPPLQYDPINILIPIAILDPPSLAGIGDGIGGCVLKKACQVAAHAM